MKDVVHAIEIDGRRTDQHREIRETLEIIVVNRGILALRDTAAKAMPSETKGREIATVVREVDPEAPHAVQLEGRRHPGTRLRDTLQEKIHQGLRRVVVHRLKGVEAHEMLHHRGPSQQKTHKPSARGFS